MTWRLSAFADEAGPELGQQIDACRNTGLRWIDLRTVGEHNITMLPLELAQQAAQRLAGAGIGVHMFGSPIGKIDITDDFQADLDRLEHLGRLAEPLGCRRVRLFSYYNKSGVPKDRWRDQAINRLTRLRDRAAELDLELYHENESGVFGDHPQDVLALAELCDGQRFRLIYDFANYQRTGVAGLDAWALFRGRTHCFHFKDQRADGEHVPMGQGDTDAAAIVREAVADGWSGFAVVEPHLSMSKAVVATHVSGQGSAALAELSPAESFAAAVSATRELLQDGGATLEEKA